ncbi:MAG: hypothetical protein N3F09_05310 [Bacteroidia bacterium]|nr:hypothetical protein [Bacteroidia bacterium]
MKKIIFFLLGILCLGLKNSDLKKEAPPKMIWFEEAGLYIDQTCIENFDYAEFLIYLKKHYGENSKQYKSMLPVELTVISEKNKINYSDKSMFFYPVLGISKKQAMAFTEWRQNRVFEFMCFKKKLIPNQEDTFFTIERYFTGKIPGSKVDYNLNYYDFELPSTEILRKIPLHNEQLVKAGVFKKRKYNGFLIEYNGEQARVYYQEVKSKYKNRYIYYFPEIPEYSKDDLDDMMLLKTFRNIAVPKKWSNL